VKEKHFRSFAFAHVLLNVILFNLFNWKAFKLEGQTCAQHRTRVGRVDGNEYEIRRKEIHEKSTEFHSPNTQAAAAARKSDNFSTKKIKQQSTLPFVAKCFKAKHLHKHATVRICESNDCALTTSNERVLFE